MLVFQFFFCPPLYMIYDSNEYRNNKKYYVNDSATLSVLESAHNNNNQILKNYTLFL